jgi:hypothetical protein
MTSIPPRVWLVMQTLGKDGSLQDEQFPVSGSLGALLSVLGRGRENRRGHSRASHINAWHGVALKKLITPRL